MECTHQKLIEQRQEGLVAAFDVSNSVSVDAICPACGRVCHLQALHAHQKWLVIVEAVRAAAATMVWVVYTDHDVTLRAVFPQ